MTDVVPVAAQQRHDGDRRPSRRRKLVIAVVVLLLCVVLVAWWLVTMPRLTGGGLADVSSSDHDVVSASGLSESVYVVPADGPGSSTLAFGLRNDGPFPVEIVDIWPSTEEPTCFWQPRERWFQDDHRYLGVLDDRARPAAGAVLQPGAFATVWITGAHPDPDGCVHGGITFHDDVEVTVSAGGRTSTTRVPLGYTFGYSDEPESLREFYDYRVSSSGS